MSRYKRPTVRYTLEPGAHVDSWHRFSTDHQDDASALVAIERFCGERGFVNDRQWGRPATSGSIITSTREFLSFIAAMEERQQADRRERGIIVWSLSRLGRDQNETEYYTAYLRKLGYVVLSISDPIPANDTAPIVEAIVRYQDEKDLERISVSVKRSFEMIRQDGYVTGGFPPRGFIAVKEQNQVHPTRHKGLPRINARWVRGGEYEEAVSEAWAMKVRGASDTDIHEATHVFKAKHCYHDMWKRHAYVDADYVSEDNWQTIRLAMLERSTAQRPRLGTGSYALAGLVYCPECGRLMIGKSQPRRRDYKRQGSYRPGPDSISYYVCPGARQHAGCTMGALHAEHLQDAVVHIVSEHILTDEHLDELRTRIGDELSTEQDRLSRRLSTLREQEQRIAAQVDRLKLAIADAEGAAIKILVSTLNERARQKEMVEQEIAETERQRKRQNPQVISDDNWRGLVSYMRDGLNQTDPARVRDALRMIVQRVGIWPSKDGVTVQYQLGQEGGAMLLAGTPEAVRTKVQPHIAQSMPHAWALTRHGNQHTTRKTA